MSFSKLKPAPNWLTQFPIAHRGFHNLQAGRAENSILGFRAAIDAGFAIECDLQSAGDHTAMVFHDSVLGRMTGAHGETRSRSSIELSKLRLLETNDTIQSLRQHLDVVQGRVPLVLELKRMIENNKLFLEKIAQELDDYEGPVAVMSFDHWLCSQFKTIMPEVPRGLTAEGNESTYKVHARAMVEYDLQFMSYGVTDLPCRVVKECREAGLPVITWTVRNENERKVTMDFADQMTFEGFDPRDIET